MMEAAGFGASSSGQRRGRKGLEEQQDCLEALTVGYNRGGDAIL